MKPTPGPWKVEGETSRVRLLEGDDEGLLCREVSADGVWIAQVAPLYVDTRYLKKGGNARIGEGDANARLIAAAPELLASLRAVLTAGNKPDLSEKANRDAFDAAILDGWAAIAKAEGRV